MLPQKLVHLKSEFRHQNKENSRRCQIRKNNLKTKKANFKRRVCMTKPRVPRRTNKKINGYKSKTKNLE